jgi:hypothetical protein
MAENKSFGNQDSTKNVIPSTGLGNDCFLDKNRYELKNHVLNYQKKTEILPH